MFNKPIVKEDSMIKNNSTKVENDLSFMNTNNSFNEGDSDFEIIHKIQNKIRNETLLACKPNKNSISYLIYSNNIKKLYDKLQNEDLYLDQRDDNGLSCSWTPLYWCVKLKRYDCAELLLQNGANINIVINDFDECCGTALDLAILRNDEKMEKLLREYAEKDDVNLGQAFKAIRTKLRGKSPTFNFNYYGKKAQENIL